MLWLASFIGVVLVNVNRRAGGTPRPTAALVVPRRMVQPGVIRLLAAADSAERRRQPTVARSG
jgi:hypothetical protein